MTSQRPWALLALLAVAFHSTPARADEAAARTAAESIATRMFSELQKPDADRAADAIALEFQLDATGRKRFQAKLRTLIKGAGRLETWALQGLTGLPGGDRYWRAVIVSYHERRPVGWVLSLYRTATGEWTVLDLSFESDDVPGFVARHLPG